MEERIERLEKNVKQLRSTIKLLTSTLRPSHSQVNSTPQEAFKQPATGWSASGYKNGTEAMSKEAEPKR